MEPVLLTIKDVMQLTQLSRTKVYELIRDGELPSVRIDKSVRVRTEDLDRWIMRHTDSSNGPASSPSTDSCPACGGHLPAPPSQKVVSLQKAAVRDRHYKR